MTDDNSPHNQILPDSVLDALDAETRRSNAAAAPPAELTEWRDVYAQIALTAAPLKPAPECLDNILAKIKNQSTVSAAKVLSNGHQIAAANSNVVQFPIRQSRRNRTKYAVGIGAIAAAIAIIFLSVALFRASRQSNERIAELNQKLAHAEQQLSDAESRLEREQQTREFVASPETTVFTLAGTKDSPTAKARFVFDRKTGQAFLFVENLPDAPAGKAYQIWWITDPQHPAPGGTFKTAVNGKGELRDQIPAAYTNAEKFAVTLEPESGSPAPTGKAVLANL